MLRRQSSHTLSSIDPHENPKPFETDDHEDHAQRNDTFLSDTLFSTTADSARSAQGGFSSNGSRRVGVAKSTGRNEWVEDRRLTRRNTLDCTAGDFIRQHDDDAILELLAGLSPKRRRCFLNRRLKTELLKKQRLYRKTNRVGTVDRYSGVVAAEESGDASLVMITKPTLYELIAVCQAEAYDLQKLFDVLLQRKYWARFFCDGNVLAFELPRELLPCDIKYSTPTSSFYRARSVDAMPPSLMAYSGTTADDGNVGSVSFDSGHRARAFVSGKSGVVIVWGLEEAAALHSNNTSTVASTLSDLIFFLSPFAEKHLRPDWCAEEIMRYCYLDELPMSTVVPETRVKQDVIYLKTNSIEEKLAASLALGQSLRLDVFENGLASSIRKFEEIPLNMSKGFSKVAETEYNSQENINLRKDMAQLYCTIIDVNICQDLLDVPDYFWDDDTWQNFYYRLYAYLEIESRIDVLNQRYTCIQDLLAVVNDVRQYGQQTRLTWVIIGLLSVQCICVALRAVLDPPL